MLQAFFKVTVAKNQITKKECRIEMNIMNTCARYLKKILMAWMSQSKMIYQVMCSRVPKKYRRRRCLDAAPFIDVSAEG